MRQIAVLRFYAHLSDLLHYSDEILAQEEVLKHMGWLVDHFEQNRLFDYMLSKFMMMIEKGYQTQQSSYADYSHLYHFLEYHLVRNDIEKSKQQLLAQKTPHLLLKIAPLADIQLDLILKNFSLLVMHVQQHPKDPASKVDLITRLIDTIIHVGCLGDIRHNGADMSLLYFLQYLLTESKCSATTGNIFQDKRLQFFVLIARLKIFEQRGESVKLKEAWFNWHRFFGLIGVETKKIIFTSLENTLTYFALGKESPKRIHDSIESWCKIRPLVLSKEEQAKLKRLVDIKVSSSS